MLSIGKLGTGHSAYYELSVASGAEDYYTGRGEARGWYLGAGSDALGLEGIVEAGDLKHVFDGTHPRSGERWIRRQQHDKGPRTIRLPDGRVIEGAAPIPTAAFDLTFSAPKSVSVLWGLGSHPVRRDVRDAHEQAVLAAFDYLERTACVTRRGKGGARHLRGEGFVSAAFHHRVSRAGDPQLHTHVLVANATRAEGRYTALHGALLYREAKTAGFLYHAALRSELTRRLGVEWQRDASSPHPELAGIPAQLRVEFSTRAAEIGKQLALSGHTSAQAANAAALDTRAAKTYLDGPTDLHDRWQNQARSIDAPDVNDAIARTAPRTPILTNTTATIEEAATEAFAPSGLTAHKTTFHRRDIIQVACEHAPQGASVSQIERLADAILDHARADIFQLRSEARPAVDRSAQRADGFVLADGRADTPYTTRELLEHELAIITSAHQRTHDRVAQVAPRIVEQVIDERDAHRRLADDQRRMVAHLTTSGAGVEAVVGLAGAGKTFSLEAAHDTWQRAEIEVRGCATALTAAKTLESETRIPSETIATIRMHHEYDNVRQLDELIPKRGVLIVDEAGMTETRDLSLLARLAADRDTKLVLVGDHHQLPEIGAGGAFKHLVHNLQGTTHLTTNRRQHAAWERDTLGELRAGSVATAIANYAHRDRIITSPSPEQLRQRLVTDWLNARLHGRDTAMIAYTNADITALNAEARRVLDERGRLGPARVTAGGLEWARGDELICTKNRRKLGLANGTRGTVQHVSPKGLEIRTPDGADLHVPIDYLRRGHATHAYATTGHKTQGLTINGEAFVLATDHISREWLYVTLSRARDRSRIYIDTLDHDPAIARRRTPQQQRDAAILDLYDLVLRSHSQTFAHDQGHAIDPQHLDRNDLRRALQRDQALQERMRSRPRGQPERQIGRGR